MLSRSPLLASPLVLVLVLACSSSSSPPREQAEATPTASEIERAPAATERPRRPEPGERAPALALDSLAGARVSLPAMSDSDRAALLIFGSFS